MTNISFTTSLKRLVIVNIFGSHFVQISAIGLLGYLNEHSIF